MPFLPYSKRIDLHCCDEKDLQAIGLGTERLEEVLQKHFPNVPMMRMDRDTTRSRGKMEELLSGSENGSYRILIGTQMLAKGHHFPNVPLWVLWIPTAGFLVVIFVPANAWVS